MTTTTAAGARAPPRRVSGGKTGGSIKIDETSFPDFLDPALSYTVDGWEALNGVYTGLVTYAHVGGQDGAKVVPGLAEDMPKISADGKTYDFVLRDGLKFSDGTPVKASDFKHSIERILAQDSQGSGLGYTSIVGRRGLPEDQEGRHHRHQGRRRQAHHLDRADQAARPVPLRAGHPVRERRALAARPTRT